MMVCTHKRGLRRPGVGDGERAKAGIGFGDVVQATADESRTAKAGNALLLACIPGKDAVIYKVGWARYMELFECVERFLEPSTSRPVHRLCTTNEIKVGDKRVAECLLCGCMDADELSRKDYVKGMSLAASEVEHSLGLFGTRRKGEAGPEEWISEADISPSGTRRCNCEFPSRIEACRFRQYRSKNFYGKRVDIHQGIATAEECDFGIDEGGGVGKEGGIKLRYQAVNLLDAFQVCSSSGPEK